MRRLGGLSFRARIMLALLGAVAAIVVVALLVVRAQTERVTADFTTREQLRSHAAFEQVERVNRGQLASLGGRFAASNRLPAVLQESLFSGVDEEDFVEDVGYELDLANATAALVAFTDLDGNPIAAISDRALLADAATAIPAELMRATIARVDTTAFGYHAYGDRLYSMHARLLRLDVEPVGFVVLGTPIDDELAASLRPAGGHLCFAAAGRCYASTLTATDALTTADLVAAAAGAVYLRREGRPWALMGDTLAGGAGIARVIALPLDEVQAPFARIQRAIRLAGIGALLVGLAFALLIARGLARPVRALVRATEQVARGDYTVEVESRSRDDIGALAAAFNEMTRGLRLKEQYRGLLDKVVSPEIAAEMIRADVQLGGETREVTTLFADIRGFTPMTEGMQPAEIVAFLNEVLERASAAVEAEGGVVDKYVGDEVMALFGAPLSAPDDAVRAVRAAVRMRDAIAQLSRERSTRGDVGIAVGIGINTGPVVAGNMGSARRLNYTVIGEAVNVAARLCSAAQPNEILIGEATYRQLDGAADVRDAGERQLKGLSRAVAVYVVAGLRSTVAAGAGLALALLMSLGADDAHTQRRVQFDLSARVTATLYAPRDESAWLLGETRVFVAPRAALLADIFAGDHLYAFLEGVADRGETPADRPLGVRLEQAFLRVSPLPADAHVQFGRFVSPFGEYPQRHDTSSDPFLRPPLPYQQRTIIAARTVPGTVDGFLDWKNAPADSFRARGAPVVWNTPYQLGAMLFGSYRALSARVALMNSAPSSEPAAWNEVAALVERPSVVAHTRVRIRPELFVGISYNSGPYLSTTLPGRLPQSSGADTDRDEFDQTIWGFDAAFARERVQVRAELFLDSWLVPNVHEPVRDVSYSAEAMVRVRTGVELAARYGASHYNELRRSNGVLEPWDHDTRRIQLAAGYRVTHGTQLRAEWLINPANDGDLFSLRFDRLFERLF
ncbi:MAG TPA: adenylate/guanylate cyclase domain-containing protein [Longimicrobiales bacterium]|nr:adenylate/guanylate cyclase domain-containing protein [Longimicrobiales bacterium]